MTPNNDDFKSKINSAFVKYKKETIIFVVMPRNEI